VEEWGTGKRLRCVIKKLIFWAAAVILVITGLLVARKVQSNERDDPNSSAQRSQEQVAPVTLTEGQYSGSSGSPHNAPPIRKRNADGGTTLKVSGSSKGLREYTKEEVTSLIEYYSTLYGYSAEKAKKIAFCESGYRWDAKNKYSTASGVFQYVRGTWSGTEEGRNGESPLNADANIRAAIRYLSTNQNARPWAASIGCHGVR
jgi:hypothetical protein